MAALQGVGFGTSGLRGPADEFSAHLVAAYVGAFLETACADASSMHVAIGADLRESSPGITGLVAASVRDSGWEPVYAGTVPTPALAAHSFANCIPAIMVTGSHVPARFNGLKFYRPHGELLKTDEAPVEEAARRRLAGAGPAPAPQMPQLRAAVAEDYKNRYLDCFESDALQGLKVGVFAHSAVGSDVLAAILAALGAECHVFGRVEHFVAVDTEAVEDRHLATMCAALTSRGLDAIVSTDGDGDRPLLLDEAGRQVNGDVLGALCARALGARTVVTPLTATSAIEGSGWFSRVIRTRIGSPHVIAAMAHTAEPPVVGFEPNGGFLVQTPVRLGTGRLAALPTRDAVLPILTVLGESVRRRLTVSELVSELPGRVVQADRIKDVLREAGAAFVAAMAGSRAQRAGFEPMLADPLSIDTTDGTRLHLAGGQVVHFRQSGNAPELRCYVEADSASESDALLHAMMTRLVQAFGKEV